MPPVSDVASLIPAALAALFGSAGTPRWFVPVGDEWLIQHRFVSTDWRAPDSVMAAPSSVS